jgi:hypothetical protein
MRRGGEGKLVYDRLRSLLRTRRRGEQQYRYESGDDSLHIADPKLTLRHKAHEENEDHQESL